MKLKPNLIDDDEKNNIEINNCSIKGFFWHENQVNKTQVDLLKKELKLDNYIAKLATARGVTLKNFINYTQPKIKTSIPDPFVLDDMKKATDKIVQYIKNKDKIGILGDYDVDGSSATSLLCNFFYDIGVDHEFYIPDRIKEGYGPNINALKSLKEKGCNLVLTLDCGTTAISTIDEINKENTEIIVVDHHQEAESLPNAYAIINPKKKKDSSKLNNLCATGVVFFLVISINRELKKINFYNSTSPNLMKYLDLVALATICDLVKLDEINRAFVKQGIKVINQTTNIGLNSLVEESSINQFINEYHLGFILGPRINAGGRVGNSRIGVDLLTSKDKQISKILSEKLCDFNDLRKSIEKKVENEAMDQVKCDEDNIICVNKKDWHPGVLGIVASRLTEKFIRPSIVISENSEICSASCRSVKSFDIGKFIIHSVDNGILITGGGHKMAGGFTIEKSKIQEFKATLKDKFSRDKNDLKKNYESELKISLINNDLYTKLNKFSPFGMGNPKPRFIIKDCFIKFPKIVGRKHYSFYLEDLYSNRIKTISFNSLGTKLGHIIESPNLLKAAVVSISLNSWAGVEKTELLLEDIVV